MFERRARLITLLVLVCTLFVTPMATVYAAPPANDDIANATVITSLPFSEQLDASEATWDDFGPVAYVCPMGPEFDLGTSVWYKYTPSVTHYVGISIPAGGGGYWREGMYRGKLGSLQIVGCDDGRYLAEAGQTYYLMVAGGGIFNLTMKDVSPPNDYIDHAKVITSLPFSEQRYVTNATWDDPGAYQCGSGENVWYAYTASERLFMRFTTVNGGWRPLMDLYSGSPGGLSWVACASPVVEFWAEPGVTYYLMISTDGGGDLVLDVTGYRPPPNDDIANARVITALPYTDSLDTTGATWDSPGDVVDCIGGPNVWYRYTPSETHYVGVSIPTEDGSYWPEGMYRGAPGSLQIMGCNDYRYLAEAGQTYYLMIGGGGMLNLTVDDLGPPFSIDLALDQKGVVNTRTGVATISGRVSTTHPAGLLWVEGELRQKLGRKTMIVGSFGVPVECNDGQATWSAVVRSNLGAYGGGPAEVVANTGGCGQWTGCDDAQVAATITLTGGGGK